MAGYQRESVARQSPFNTGPGQTGGKMQVLVRTCHRTSPAHSSLRFPVAHREARSLARTSGNRSAPRFVPVSFVSPHPQHLVIPPNTCVGCSASMSFNPRCTASASRREISVTRWCESWTLKASGLSPANVVRLKASWGADCQVWRHRELDRCASMIRTAGGWLSPAGLTRSR